MASISMSPPFCSWRIPRGSTTLTTSVKAKPAVSASRNRIGRTSATKATNQTIATVHTTVGGEVRPLHDGDVQVDVVDRVEGEHRERARGRRRGGDREGDARAVGRPPGEADEAVRQGREDADPRRHAHQHLR